NPKWPFVPPSQPVPVEVRVYATNRHTLDTPSKICRAPAMTTIISASVRLSAWLVRIAAMATIIGAVGPEIWARVPPKTAAKNPTAMALYNQAGAPIREAKPNPRATGSVITMLVRPPKKSPRSAVRL
ncbi:MAG: hypothetical protein OXI44_06970, partial [Bacteroidota bacterium]|nr:hypothetical protein [Bacteroidota bacterium]